MGSKDCDWNVKIAANFFLCWKIGYLADNIYNSVDVLISTLELEWWTKNSNYGLDNAH